MYSSDTNYQVMQQVLSLPNKANAACPAQQWDMMFSHCTQCAKRPVQLQTRQARRTWTLQRDHLAVQVKIGDK